MHIDRPIIIAIILLATVLLVFFLVRPEYNKFLVLRADLAEKKAEFNAKYEYFSVITEKYFNLQDRKEEIKKIDDALPEGKNLGRLFYFFQKIAAENGLIPKDVLLSKAAATGQQSELSNTNFSLAILGNYSALENFIISLERSARLFEITKISFGSSSKSGAKAPLSQFQTQGSFTFSLEVKTQSYPAPAGENKSPGASSQTP